MAKYRCPVDDTIFDTRTTDRVPTLLGHPDCTGPECRKNFSGGKIVVLAETEKAAETLPAAPSLEAALGQGW